MIGPFPGIPRMDERVYRILFREPIFFEVNKNCTKAETQIIALNRKMGAVENTFGLEHRVQYSLIKKNGDAVSRKAFFRLSQEPLILTNLETLSGKGLSLDFASDFVSLLCGRKIRERDIEMWARGPAGTFVYFEDRDQSKNWLSDVKVLLDLPMSPLQKAIACYSRVVAAHSFSDGNGRFARAILYGVLAREGLINSPCLALGTAFKYHSAIAAEATVNLSQTGDWVKYTDTFSLLILEAIRYVKTSLG